MANLKVDTVSGIGTEGPVLNGGLHFRSKNYLTLPKGNTTERTATSSGISTVIGARRYNTDSNKKECYVNNKWMIVSTSSPNLDGGGHGLVAGGNTPNQQSIIDFITIASEGNATDFGELITAISNSQPASNSIIGLNMGGGNGNTNTIEFITIATTGNGADYGDLYLGQGEGAGCSDSHGGI